jgi:glucokinase
MKECAIGIDLGGTNLKGLIIERDGSARHLTKMLTEAERGGARVLENILTMIDTLVRKEGSNGHIIGIGIGTPGFVSEDGVVWGAENLPGWAGTQLYEPIAGRFSLPAVAANDVTVMALAEALFGAGRGVRNLVCYALGTGIGGGIVIDHKLYKGTSGMAGELGHVSVETNGILCNCGQRGCVERYASATGIVFLAKELAAACPDADISPFVKEVRANPDGVTSRMVYGYAAEGDPVACAVNERVCDMLARAIGITLNTLSPDRVVLGGGVLQAGQIIIDTVKKYLPEYCWPMIRERCDIVAAALGEEAGVMGAGAMVFDK